MTKASDLLVAALEAEGVKSVFGVPGEENLDLVESLRRSTIELVLTRHEQAAGFMAATHGRLTGRVGVCLATLGPGATNLVTAAAHAQLGAMPMLMITGQKPIRNHRQGHFQMVDVVGMMRPLTKYTHQLVSAESIPAQVREAIRRAEEERPGAVHLELPQDIAAESTAAKLIAPAHSRRPLAEQKAIAWAASALSQAKRPLLMLGAGANRKMTAKMLCELIAKLGIPFFSTQMGKGVLDETDPLWLGTAALSDHDYVHRAIDAADCILNIGHDVIEKPPFFMRDDERTVIHVNYASAEVDPVYFPQIEVIGDIANAIWQLTEAVEPQPHWTFGFFDRVRLAMLEQLSQGADDPRFPLTSQRVVADVSRALGPEDIVCLDNGLYKLWFARHFRCRRPNTLLLDNALATMGAGLPTAMAARIVHPDRKVLAVCGDGGFMLGNLTEFNTAVGEKMDIIAIVFDDGSYGAEHIQLCEKQIDPGISLFDWPEFATVAAALGGEGVTVRSVEDLNALPARLAARSGDRPILITIKLDPDHIAMW